LSVELWECLERAGAVPGLNRGERGVQTFVIQFGGAAIATRGSKPERTRDSA
jgi:hypothetical protein